MPAYASVTQLKEDHLTQLRDDSEWDGALGRCLDAATALIDSELGYSFAAAAASTRVVYGDGTHYLELPADLDTDAAITVTTISGYTVPSYVRQGGYLVSTDATGILYGATWPYGLQSSTYSGGWVKHVPYTVAGTYGYGATVPEDIKRLCCEIARDFWYDRDRRPITEEGVLTAPPALSERQKAVLEAHRAGVSSSVGVF